MKRFRVRYVFDRKNEATLSTVQGLLQIEVRLVGTNKRVLISTGLKLYKNQFSAKDGFTCKNHPNANSVTAKARAVFYKVEEFVNSEYCQRIEDVKKWNMPKEGMISFISFIEEQMRTFDMSNDSMRAIRGVVNRVKEFGRLETFADVTVDNITDFDLFLRKYIKSSATLHKRHTQLHRFIRVAVRKGFIKNDPYDEFVIKKGKSKEPTFLTSEEVERIFRYNADIQGFERLQEAKDLFLFQCYTGLSYIDTQKFSRDDVVDMDGYKVIRSNRTKTDSSFVCLLLPEAEAIAETYGYTLPRIPNQKYNQYLKMLGAGANINKNLTTHVGRHTFATYLLNKNIPIETISRAMGHSSIKQTQHYARMLGKKVVSDMAVLLNKGGG